MGLSLLLLVGGLAACSSEPPPWQAAETASPSAAAAKTATPTATPSASSTPTEPARNDLATGSTKRRLVAGGVRFSVNYWSTLSMQEWAPGAAKPVSLSASGEFDDGSEQDIYLSRVTMGVDVQGAAGALEAPDSLVDKAKVEPGYLVTSPSSYGQVFTVPGVNPEATSVTLNLTYELLVQAAPKSKRYSKQTASDTLVVALTSS